MGRMKDLFGDVPIEFGEPVARRTDPITSHQAALRARIKAGSNRANCLLALARHPRGLTDYELADIVGLQQNSAGKRRGELRDAGLVFETTERRNSPTGTPIIVWRVNEAGSEYAQWLKNQ